MRTEFDESQQLRIGFIGKVNEEQLAVITDQRRGAYVGTYVLPAENTPLTHIMNPELSWNHEMYVSEPWDDDTLAELRETHQIALQFIQQVIDRMKQQPKQSQTPLSDAMAVTTAAY